jgi:hypothetical protein
MQYRTSRETNYTANSRPRYLSITLLFRNPIGTSPTDEPPNYHGMGDSEIPKAAVGTRSKPKVLRKSGRKHNEHEGFACVVCFPHRPFPQLIFKLVFVFRLYIGGSFKVLLPMRLMTGNCIEKYNGLEVALELVSGRDRHCIRQQLKSAVECSAELLGRPILKPILSHFTCQ